MKQYLPSSYYLRKTKERNESAIERMPLVSCIMPTCNRSHFIGQAIKYFFRQDYSNSELIVIDDGVDSVAELIPTNKRVRYIRLEHPLSLGLKRNLACNNSHGEIIIHWDDDDWMSDWRISYQVSALKASRADICGLSKLIFYDPILSKAWQYNYPFKKTQLLAGGSLCYTKKYWEDNPFQDVNIGEDTLFVWSNSEKKILSLEKNTFYIAINHDNNTNYRRTNEKNWSCYALHKLQNILNKDFNFYYKMSHDNVINAIDVCNVADIMVMSDSDKPLISCVMPTHNRRWCISKSIGYFLSQDYPNKELIIVDDGADPIEDVIPFNERVRYIRLDKKRSAGFKRNVAVKASKGKIIAHWDDDDWYANDRLSNQVIPLLDSKVKISGYKIKYFFDACENKYWSCNSKQHDRMFFSGVHGRSLMYEKNLWEKYSKYPDESIGDDAYFLRSLQLKGLTVARLTGDDKVIYVRHGENAWDFKCGSYLDPYGWIIVNQPPFVSNIDMQFDRHNPRVSCIMPTFNRRCFVPQAIGYFLRQDYKNRELIIVDDGTDPVNDLIPDDKNIKYIRLNKKLEIGEKRNIACEKSEGDIIILWDDDDWYSSLRISRQVQPLLDGKADVTGFNKCILLSLQTHRFWSCSDQLHEKMFFEGVVGGTLAFRKTYWDKGIRFPNTSLGEDAHFLKMILNKGARIKKLDNDDLFVYIRHEMNSWEFLEGRYLDRKSWINITKPKFVPREDLKFYGFNINYD